MDGDSGWWDRRWWRGLTDVEFRATERARARLAHTFPGFVLCELDPRHPLRRALHFPSMQRQLTILGEALRRFVPRGGPLEGPIAADLRHAPMYISRVAELEAAYCFEERGCAVRYQPGARGERGPDLLVRGPQGPAIPVEVKAPRPSKTQLAYETFACDCVLTYQRLLDERGLSEFVLCIESDRRDPEAWTEPHHAQVLQFLEAPLRAGRPKRRQRVGRDWWVRVEKSRYRQRSASVDAGGLLEVGCEVPRLEKMLSKASEQLAAAGGEAARRGLVVLHGLALRQGSLTPGRVAQALARFDASPIAQVWACQSGRTHPQMIRLA